MSNRLERQDTDDMKHSLLILMLLGIIFISYWVGTQHRQKEIENRVKSTQMTVEENARVEVILFGETQE